MHEVLVNRLGGLSLSRKSVVRLTDRPYMTLDVYRGCKTTIQYNMSLMVEATILSILNTIGNIFPGFGFFVKIYSLESSKIDL